MPSAMRALPLKSASRSSSSFTRSATPMQLHKDLREFVELLNSNKVDYVVVDAYPRIEQGRNLSAARSHSKAKDLISRDERRWTQIEPKMFSSAFICVHPCYLVNFCCDGLLRSKRRTFAPGWEELRCAANVSSQERRRARADGDAGPRRRPSTCAGSARRDSTGARAPAGRAKGSWWSGCSGRRRRRLPLGMG